MPLPSDDAAAPRSIGAPGRKGAAAVAPAAGAKAKGATEAPKKSKKKLIIIIFVVLALGGLKEKALFIKPHYSAKHPAPNGEIYPLANTSPFTVTTSDGHLVQTNIALQLTTVASSKKLAMDEPAIESIVIKIFGDATYPELLSPSGRSACATEMLKEIQALLGPVDGSVQVSAIYFTGTFVLQ